MSVRTRHWTVLVAAVGLLLAMTACSAASTPAADAAAPPPGSVDASGPSGDLTVFAAASLKAPFTELGEQFEAAHPGATVRFNFAGSSDLVAQLQQGAPADVLATADTRTMDRAAEDQLLAGPPTSFATNTMTIAVPPDNPAGVATFADLAGPDVRVVVCAPQVPCGATVQEVEARTGITLAPVSEESSVSDVLNKVVTGEADAGVVYVTDAKGSAGRVTGVPIPAEVNAVTAYPIAVLADAPAPMLAQQFESLVLGPQGQEVLADGGFGPP